MMNKRIVIITGASSGIGLAAAELFYRKGDTVYGLSRRPCPNEGVISLRADVTSDESVSRAVDEVISREGRIDVMICNAGFGISGAVEFTETAEVIRQFDVNVLGTVRCVQAALPYMRRSRKGTIIITSSVAGIVSIPFQAYYSATKASLNSIALALANEVRPYNVKVCAVMPGDIRTGFTDARMKLDQGAEEYPALNRSVASMERDERKGMPPSAIAGKMYRLSLKRNPKPLSTAGIQYKLCCLLIKLLPCRLANRVVGLLYS